MRVGEGLGVRVPQKKNSQPEGWEYRRGPTISPVGSEDFTPDKGKLLVSLKEGEISRISLSVGLV